MSFIDFESGSAKERARQELREARAELLVQAEKRFNHRQQLEAQRKLRGEDDWMLPAVARKLEKSADTLATSTKSKKSKKDKKSKKAKKEKKAKSKKRKKRASSTDSSGSSSDSDGDENAGRRRKSRKSKHRKRRSSSSESSGSGSASDEWVEPASNSKSQSATEPPKVVQRDDWMSGILIPTFTKPVQEKKKDDRKDIDSYDPAKSSRELNPFWKNGGGGLPSASTSGASASFKKPRNDSDDDDDDDTGGGYRDRRARNSASQPSTSSASRGNWRKTKPSAEQRHRDRSASPDRRRASRRSRSRSPTPEKGNRGPNRHTASSSSSRSVSPANVVEASQSTAGEPSSAGRQDFLTDQQMNDLGAKVMRAEIMGNTELVDSLKAKLAAARLHRDTHKANLLAAARAKATAAPSAGGRRGAESEDVLLTATSSRGFSKPLQRTATAPVADPWGGKSGRKNKSKRVDTHSAGGERERYFADDDKYDIKQMFENEKFTTGHDQDAQFVDIAGRHKNPNDDLEDLFAEHAQKGVSDADAAGRERTRAIRQHQEITKSLDTCDKCFDSPKMQKQLIVAMGTNVYLALPWHEGLLTGHCQIVPVQHVPCATQLDEDVWAEVVDFQKAITKMFRARGQDVIFFETARYLHRRTHMVINCVPHADFALAPFYFKKAIQESEREWSTNKQLVTLREKDLRRSIPKGLPYFWVHFGVDSGFAHVIEEQDRFPANFAQEIIGGSLELDPRMWRRQRKEQNSIERVTQVADWWKPFDITSD